MEGKEFVELKVRVPVQVVEWLEAFGVDVQQYLEEGILENFGSDLDFYFGGATIFMNAKIERLKARLREVPYLAENHKLVLDP